LETKLRTQEWRSNGINDWQIVCELSAEPPLCQEACKKYDLHWVPLLTPEILVTQEAEIRRIMVQGQVR
jgi:hypothetical protein